MLVCTGRVRAAPLTPCCGPQVLADAVARLVLDKFGDLTDNFSSPHARRKVLAGIVMTTGKTLGCLSSRLKKRGRWSDCDHLWDPDGNYLPNSSESLSYADVGIAPTIVQFRNLRFLFGDGTLY